MIVIGASSGGLRALQAILGGLPADFPLAIAVVLHRYKDPDDSLQIALQRGSALPVMDVVDKMTIRPGRVYVAPADYHLLVEPDYFSLSVDEPVLYARPSVDVLFESAADVFGARTIGVILTGSGQDGARGSLAIANAGGRIIVQDPATAESFMMPTATLGTVPTSLKLPLAEIAASLIKLARK